MPELHGLSRTPDYKVWLSMRQRCNDKAQDNYEYYGGRGIKVCERWNSYTNFLSDMGKKPSPEYELDRIDCDGDYEPNNCRWVTRVEQARNKRVYKSNKSGFKGVHWTKSYGGAWTAQIRHMGKIVYSRRFQNKLEAVKERNEALNKLVK